VLRDRNDRVAARFQCLENFRSSLGIVGNMLEHVERADNVELVGERDIANIHLEECCSAGALFREIETGDRDLAAVERELREGPANRLQDKSRPATNLKHACRSVAVSLERCDDQLVSSAEPEALCLERRQELK